MKKRYTVLGLSLVLALALAVPAMGGPTNPLASATLGTPAPRQTNEPPPPPPGALGP